jgi:hypothetical protein
MQEGICLSKIRKAIHKILLKRCAEKLNPFLQTHSIFRWLDLLNKRTANCLNKRIRFQKGSIVTTLPFCLAMKKQRRRSSEASSIVATIAVRKVATILQPQNSFNSYNLDARIDLDHTTGSKHQKRAQLSRQKPSASPRQIYQPQAGSIVSTIALRLVATKNLG